LTISLVGTFGAGVSSGNPAPVLPAGISFGDAVGAVGICSSSQTITAPAGWSVRSGFPADAGNARFYAWTKDAVTASDSGTTQTFTVSAANKVIVEGFVLHSSNGFPSDWIDDLTFQAHDTAGTSYTAPSSVSTVAGTWGVAAVGCRGTDPTAWTPASGLTERQDLQRTGSGATSLHLADSNGSVGGASTTWGPFTESNISTSAGGGLTWLVKENATGGGGGGGGGGGAIYPKVGLWADRDGVSWENALAGREAIYGPVQGHWAQYFGAGEVPLSAPVVAKINAGKLLHVYWKPMAVSGSGSTWADVASGLRDTQLDAAAASIASVAPRTVWLTIHHEPEDDHASHGGGAGWTAADYRGMWNRVRTRFNLVPVTNVVWVLVWQNSHSNPSNFFSGPGQGMITLYGNDGVMDGLVDVVAQQDYIIATTPPATLATKWLEDLEFLVTNATANRNWSYLDKPQAFTEWGADLGGVNRGTNSHRAQTIDAIRGILPDLASRNVTEIRYFDARTNIIDDPPSVDGVAFQALKDASEAGQSTGPVFVAGVALARDGATVTSSSIPFVLPTGWQQGDLAEVWLSTNSNPTMSTVPAGWVLEEGPVANSTVQVGWRFSKVLQAGEPDPTWVISQGVRPSGLMVLLRGADGTTPEHAQASLTATASGTSHAAAAVTTTAPEAFLLTAWLFRWADASGNGGVNYGTPPGTHSTEATVSVNSGANPGAGGLVASLNANPVAPGSHGSYTATVPVTSTGICGQLAILPSNVAANPSLTDTGTGADTLSVATGAVPKTLSDAGAAVESMSVAASGAPAVGFPTQRIEVAFDTQPMAPTPTWTDITPYVRWPIERGYGRPDEFSEVQPGTIRLRLNNADGRFTMGRTSGPYGSNVKVGRRLRWSETFNGTGYVRFDGHVDAWPTAWITSSAAHAEALISATDRLKRLAGVGELRSMLEEETLRDTPLAYYPLAEPDGSTSAASVAATTQGATQIRHTFDSTGGTISFGQGTGPGTDGLSAAVFAPVSQTNGIYLFGPLAGTWSSTATTLTAWFATTATPSPNAMPICSLTTSAGEALTLAVWLDGRVQWGFTGGGDQVAGNTSPDSYNDGGTHHAAITLSRSGTTVTARLYVDGAQVNTATFTYQALPVWTRVDLGGSHDGSFAGTYAGTLSHIAGYATALSATRIGQQFQAGHDGLQGERTDQRIGRIADWIALPAADRALDTGDSTVGGQATQAKQPLEAMREVERTEQSVLFCNAQGKLAFQRRSRRYNQTPALTLDGAASHIQVGLGFPGDDFGLVNDMTVTRAGGGGGRSVNQASIDEYGLARDSAEIVSETDDAAAALAQWRTSTYGDPRPRVPNLTVSLLRLARQDPAKVAAILTLELSSMVRLSNLPTQAPSSTLDVFVEGWTERLDRRTGEWTIELNCSPADGLAVWAFGTAGYGEFGQTTRVAL
jgi:hypothetical protein